MNVRGVTLVLHPVDDYVSDVIRETGDFYEASILDEIARRIHGGTLVDVGAHIGNHSAYFAEFVPHREVWAYEPYAPNVDLLRQNVARWPEVRVCPVALSDGSTRFLTLDADPGNHGHVTATHKGDTQFTAADVATGTLDSGGHHNVTLIKIDVEGFEADVLAGARETIDRCHPLILIEDWSGPPELAGYRIAAEWETQHQTFLLEPWP